jgi:hypothetical protein
MVDHTGRTGEGGSTPSSSPGRAKRAYKTPELIEYGSVAKLTQGGKGSMGDGAIFGDMMMMCL